MATADYLAAPVTTIINRLETAVIDSTSGAAGGIVGVITPLVTACFGIYIMLIVVGYMRGSNSNPVWETWMLILKFALVIGIGLNASNYADNVLPMLKEFGDNISTAIIGGGSTGGSTLDELLKFYIKTIGDDLKRISNFSWYEMIAPLFMWLIKSIIILLTLLPFVVIATVLLILAKIGILLVAAIGPLYFAFLLFPATRQYFSSWLNAAHSYALIPVFVAILCLVSVNISKEVFGGSFEQASFMDVVIAGFVNVVLICILKTIQQLASQLSAGGVNIGFSASGTAHNVRRGYGDAKAAGKTVANGAKTAGSGLSSVMRGGVSKIFGNTIKPG